MPTTETNLTQLVINELTQAQYEALTPEPNQLYLTPDTTDQDIADAVSAHNTSSTAHADIRALIPTKVSDLTDDTSTYPIDKADTLTGLTATVTELNYVDGVTSNIQTQLDGKVTSVNNVQPVNGNVTISIPSEVTETTVTNWGFTKNTGTVTSVNNIQPVNGNVTVNALVIRDYTGA